MTDIKQLLKGRKVIIYARVSGKQQKKTLPAQVKSIKKLLKAEGVKDTQIIGTFSEQASGTKIDRVELDKALELALKQKRKVVLVVRDLQRFTRNGYALGFLIWPFLEANIPVVDLLGKRATSTSVERRPDDDLLMLITAAIGGKEVDTGIDRTAEGERLAREAGIVKARLDLYPDEEVSPYPFLIEMRNNGISGRKTAEMLGRATGFTRKAYARIDDILSRPNGKTVLKEWLKVIEMIRRMEQEKGYRFKVPGKAAPKKPMVAIGRMTSGYLESPHNFAPPTQKDLDFYYDNYTQFQASR